MPAVPLGFTSKAQFYVMSQGYDNLQLKVCLALQTQHATIDSLSQHLSGLLHGFMHLSFSCKMPDKVI